MLKNDLRSKLKKKYGVKQECSALSKSYLGQQIELLIGSDVKSELVTIWRGKVKT